MFILYMKHPHLCNTRMCIDVTMHIHLTLGDVYKGLKMTYNRRRNCLQIINKLVANTLQIS